MNWKSTWWLLATTLGLFAFIWFFERHLGKKVSAPKAALIAPALKPASVSVIETVTGGLTNRVELRDEGWRLVRPIDYPAEPVFVDAFLKAFQELSAHSSISGRETSTQPDGVSDYGFNPPRARISFTQPDGDVVVELGNSSPSEKWVYVRTKDSEGVEIVDANILRYVPTAPDGWRSRALIDLRESPFNRLSIEAPSRGFELTRSNLASAWRITRPKPAKRADNYRANRLIQYILRTPIVGFVSDDPKVDLAPFGLKAPTAEIVFAQGTNRLAVVQLGASPTNNTEVVFARRLSHTNIVLLPRVLLDSVNQPFTFFRDPQLLGFDPAMVKRVDVQADETFALQRQTNGAWEIVAPVAMPADTALVNRFMTNLTTLQVVTNGWVKDIVADYAPFGLAPPRRSYAIHTNANATATNQPFAQIGIGNRPTDELDTVFARRMSEDSVYKISLGEVMRLPIRAYELRDRQIWNFDPRAATAIRITEAGKTRNLVRTNDVWTLAPGSQGVIESIAVEGQIHQLSQLRAGKWAYQGRDEQRLGLLGIFDLSHTIALTLGKGDKAQTRTIRFGKRSAGGAIYAVVELEGGTTVFEYPYRDYEIIRQFLSVP